MSKPRNSICFELTGRYALFTDHNSKGGDKSSYDIPTYQAIKGVLESIYWKPTIVWHVDRMRVMNRIQRQTKGIRPIYLNPGKNGPYNDLAYYTFLSDVRYQIEAHFEWNENRPELKKDRVDGKHWNMAKRSLEKGGRRDIFLGVRDCQGYVEPCEFGNGESYYENSKKKFDLMYHGIDYPDETGEDYLYVRFYRPEMWNGIVNFDSPENCEIRSYKCQTDGIRRFVIGRNLKPVIEEECGS